MPQPDRQAGDVTISRYVNLLAATGRRVVFAPLNGQADGPYAEALRSQGLELVAAPQTLATWLASNGRGVSAVWVARPELAAETLPLLRAHTSASIVYYTHDLHHVRMRREAELTGDQAGLDAASAMLSLETRLFAEVDCVTSPSQAESDIIRGLVPATRVVVLPPFFYEARDIHRRPARHFEPLADVLFVGGFPHRPNVDAAHFMAGDIMPLVWRHRPDARLLLVGYAPPASLQALASTRIVVTGQVASVEPFAANARLCLAALRYGAGVKGKIVQAMQLGVPVVTTTIGAEGMGLVAGRHALIADDPAALAALVLSLLSDPQKCAALSAAGAALIKQHYTRTAAKAALARAFSKRPRPMS